MQRDIFELSADIAGEHSYLMSRMNFELDEMFTSLVEKLMEETHLAEMDIYEEQNNRRMSTTKVGRHV